MEEDGSLVVLSAPYHESKDVTVEPCTLCNSLLDAVYRIMDIAIQKREHGVEHGPGFHDMVSVSEFESLSNILADQHCGKHQEFMRSAYKMENDKETRWGLSEDMVIRINLHAKKGCAILSAVIGQSSTYNQDILILDSEPHLSISPYIGRPRDEDFISIELMRQWVSNCEMDHKTSCCVPTLPSIKLSWFIDTESLCLVPAEHGVRYIALSYVWGQTEMLKTTQEMIPPLLKVGALSPNSHLRVPRVIRHAISLAAQLGERYLWVDSLCITQDDRDSLDHHIRHMASIFEAASFTIVAADGVDASHGILGIKGVSGPRTLPNPILQLSKRFGLRLRGDRNILYSPWGNRGWTLQEHVFSKRKLIFVHGSVQWICQESRCFEDMYQDSVSNRKKRRLDYEMEQELESVGELALEYPMISQIEEILWQYNNRNLTFGNDVIRAVEAVFTAYGGAFPSGFLLGLPIDFLDIALLWHHGWGDTWGAERRAAVPPDTQPPFPSWTWAGWAGTLRVGAWRAATYIKDADESRWVGKRCSTIPMLEWRYRSGCDISERTIPGQNKAYAYKQDFMGKETGLPLGWKYEREPLGPIQGDSTPEDGTTEEDSTDEGSTEEDSTEEESTEDVSNEGDTTDNDKQKYRRYGSEEFSMATPYYYSHASAPGIKFWHPVPISVGLPERATTPINGRLLCASTRRGRLWVTAAKHGRPYDADLPADTRHVDLFSDTVSVEALIVDIEGEIAGDLYISDKDDRDFVKRYERQPDEAGYPCELVAISKGNDSVYPMEPEKETYTFYNVLWIKWEDGIAYRRGVGRVKRETWETIELEGVDLILG